MAEGELTQRTRSNIEQLREKVADAFDVEIIDILKTPQRALESRVYITPTLVMRNGGETTRLVGDLSDHESVMAFMNGTSGRSQ